MICYTQPRLSPIMCLECTSPANIVICATVDLSLKMLIKLCAPLILKATSYKIVPILGLRLKIFMPSVFVLGLQS